jgi:hypothetical protein
MMQLSWKRAMFRRTSIVLTLAVPLTLGACGSDPAEHGGAGTGRSSAL